MLNIFKKQSLGNNNWKNKAEERRTEIDKLKKQHKEMSKNRDKWRTKAQKFQDKINQLSEELKKNY